MDMQASVGRVNYAHGPDVMDALNPGGHGDGPFQGEKYKNVVMKTPPAGYSMDRDAGVSIAVYALAATGKYTIEQIMDPTQIREEKAAMYDEVVKRTNEAAEGGKSDPNNDWIAEQIYNGRNAVRRMVNEEYKHIDYSDPNILSNNMFCHLANIQHIDFDCWQEASHCKDSIVKLAQKDDPKITDYTAFKDAWSDEDMAFNDIKDAVDILNRNVKSVSRGEVAHNTMAVDYGSIVASVAFLDKKINTLREVTSRDPVPDMHDWCKSEDQMEDGKLRSFMASWISDNMRYLNDDPMLAAVTIPKVLNGELLRNVTFDSETLEVKGWPSEKTIREKYTNEKDINDLSSAMSEFDTKRTDWWFSKESPVHKALRESAESLKADLDALKYGVYKDGPQKGQPLSEKDRKELLESVEKKTEQVEKDANKYLTERKGTRGTEAGNKRKAGAQKIKDLAASVREKYAAELKGYRTRDEIKSMESSESRDRIYSNFRAVIGMEYVDPEGFKKEFTKGMARRIADIEVNKGHMTAEQAEARMGKFRAGLQNDKAFNNWVNELSENSDKRMALRGLSTGEIYSKFVELKTKENKMSSDAKENAPHRQAQVQKEAKAPQAPGM